MASSSAAERRSWKILHLLYLVCQFDQNRYMLHLTEILAKNSFWRPAANAACRVDG
jgi:hypothetical protein